MQLKKVNETIQQYKTFLKSREAYDRLHIWESQQHFLNNWDTSQEDKAIMYANSLYNSVTKRLWKREAYEPKRVMELFWKFQPDMVGHLFYDLFDESKAVDGRADRFVFYCDEILKDYKKENPKSIENNHYHGGDYWMISLYLAFRYPDQYCLFDPDRFTRLLITLGSMNPPKVNDLERFFKVCRTLYGFLEKDSEVLVLHQARLNPAKHYVDKSLLLVYDYYCYVTGKHR